MLRDELVEKVAKDLSLPEDLVDKVVAWSYEKANQATKTEKEIEFSGFGKILISRSKVARRLEKLKKILAGTLNKEDSENKEKRIKSLTDKIKYLEDKS